MSTQRLCDICGRKLDTDVMDYASISAKGIPSKDVCLLCLGSSFRITLPTGLVVSGASALAGNYDPAPPAVGVPYQENPATADKPRE